MKMKKQNLEEIIKNKKVLFVTSKNLDYIRNTQEVNIIKEQASECKVIGSNSNNYLKRILFTYLKLLFTPFFCYDYVFVGFAPQLYFFFFPFIKKEKLIIDFFFSMYDTFVDDRKKVSKDSLVAKLFYKTDLYVLRKAGFVICDTKTHRDYFVSEFHIPQKKFIVIYIIANTSIYDPTKYPQKVRKRDCLDVLYFGSILPLQGIEVILDAMKLLKDDSRIKFTIIGPIGGKIKINKSDYPHTRFISWLSQQELAREISQSDVCLAGHFNGSIGKANRTIAGKTYIYKAMEKPVVLGDSEANRELFQEDTMNYYIEMGNSEMLKNLLLSIVEGTADEKNKVKSRSNF